ncbi:MAG TPA: Yip1 family protein [Allosphingosinicella sp.]|nr:Yip1 family protein [Allosphingosinicella sp.]
MTDGPVAPPPLQTPPPPAGGSSNLVTRAINILTKPSTEWRTIEAEPATTGGLIVYAAILSVLAVVFTLLGILLQPYGSYIFQAPGTLIKILIIAYVWALLPPIALGFIMDALTPNLGGVKNSTNAMKLVIYSATGYFVAAIAIILNQWLWVVLGIGYSGFLMWLGTPILMKTPSDKSPIFVAAACGIWLVLISILIVIGQRIMFSGMGYGGVVVM